MNIAYAMTKNVYSMILPSLRSLKATNPKAKVFILAEDDELPIELPMPATVINVRDQKYFPEDGVNYHNMFSYINLLKVRYPSILSVDKVIHLDIDTIICDDLMPLWKTDLKEKWFGACPEYLGTYKPFGDPYYNMGVAVINLKQMRTDGAEEPMTEYLNTVKQPWADHDAWNKYGQDKAREIDVRYNESCKTGETDNPAIIHFCSIGDWYTNPIMYRVKFLNQYK